MHKLKEMLMNELYEYEEKTKKMSGGKLSMQEIEKIHTLTDTVKNIDKIEMLEDGGYSEDTDFMGEGRMYGTSYARGRRNARRDSMGRYSRDDGYSEERRMYTDGRRYSRDGAKEHLINKAEELLNMTDSEKEKKAIHHFIRQLEED